MLRDELYNEIVKMPIIDVHSHINRDQIGAKSLDQIMFYHMIMYPLRSAGGRENRMWPEQESIDRGLPYDDWFKFWPMIEHTGFAWMLKTILRDLYGFDGPFAPDQLPRLRELHKAKTSQADWAQQVWKKANLVRILSSQLEIKPLAPGQWDSNIRFTVESAPSTGIYEYFTWPARFARMTEQTGVEITSAATMQDAVTKFYGKYDWSDKRGLVSWISSVCDFAPISDSQLNAIVKKAAGGRELDVAETRALEGQFVRMICRAMEGRTTTFQLCYGVQYVTAEPLYAHPIPKSYAEFASSFAHILGEFPHIHFNMLNGYEADEPIWCGMTQAYHNFSLANFWWETFYPSVMENAIIRRLDMVPLPKLVGFFSDGWCADYVYGRLRMVQRCWAGALANKIERGYLTKSQALKIAEYCFFQPGKDIFLANETI
jgi:glucuronate isomerase